MATTNPLVDKQKATLQPWVPPNKQYTPEESAAIRAAADPSYTARVASEQAQMQGGTAGQAAIQAAQTARDKSIGAGISSPSAQTYTYTDDANMKAMTDLNTKYGLPSDNGMNGIPIPRVATLNKPTVPTATTPMVEVSSRGANQYKPSAQLDYLGNPNVKNPSAQTPDLTPTTGQSVFTNITLDEIQKAYESGDMAKILELQNKAAYQGVQQQGQAQNQVFDAEQALIDKKQQEAQAEYDAQKAAEQAKEQADLALFKQDQTAQVDDATRRINDSSNRRADSAATSLAFQGFSRSTKAADIQDNIRQDTQAQLADINRQSARAVNEHEAALLDRMNTKLEKYQDRVDRFGDAKDQLALEKVKAQGDLMMDLFKQNPDNPANMLATAEKLSKIKLEQKKLDMEERKAVQDRAAQNFKFMTDTFGGDFISSLDGESKMVYADALGVPVSALSRVTKTMDEQKMAWDQMKYYDSQQFDLNKMGYAQDLDFKKMLFGKSLDNVTAGSKYDNLGYGQSAAGMFGGGYVFNQPMPTLDGKNQVISYNPAIASAKPDGFKFNTTLGALAGQCAWYAEQLVKLNGKNWTVGNSLQEKLGTLNNLVKKGDAFMKGQGQPQVGNTIISNDSKTYGHVSVINGITPDGKLILTESNRAAPLTVTNTRTIDPNDPSIYGFIKTMPEGAFNLAKTIGGAVGSLVGKTPIGQSVGNLFNAIGKANLMPKQSEALSPFRQAVQGGTSKLTDAQELEFANSNPQGFQQYQQDKMMGAKAEGGASAAELRQTRKEFYNLPITQKFSDLTNSYNGLDATYNAYKGGKLGNNAVDQSLITLFNKMLDPGSVVREGEYARTAEGQAALARATNYLSYLFKGGANINDQTRADMVSLAKTLKDSAQQEFNRQAQFYVDYSKDLGSKPENVLGSYYQYYKPQGQQQTETSDLDLWNNL